MQILKKITALILVAFFTIQFTTAQTIEKKDTKLTKTLLWKITGKGIKPSYLFGTIHIIEAKDFFWDKKMQKAFKKTTKLVMEMDMSQMMLVSLQMLKLAPMEGDTQLKNLINAEDYQLVKNYFEKEAKSPQLKMTPFEMVENWKPMLTQSLLYSEMMSGATKSYEMELTSMGQEAKMSFGGLETLEDQMGIFNKIPYKAQAEALVETIKNLKKGETGENEFAKMVAIYKTQDVDGMVEATAKDLAEMEGQEALLDGRNKKWIPKILAMSKNDKVFYAVGAAHLGGENGVIRLLRKQGLKVEPVLK